MNRLIVLHADDNVATVSEALVAGDVIEHRGTKIRAATDVPACHKIALGPIAQAGQVVKYGHYIGHATQAIEVGEHVHTHNMALEES